ncbi:MAG: DUF4870 domain-containing protein [Deltaproteobacteria bacterium]|nr:DUF4870 domain-containing protein [Deltaproteobacteria bacterium]
MRQSPGMDTPDTSIVSSSERNWALFIHLSTFFTFVVPMLGYFAPILFWTVKRKESAFLDDQGREAANFVVSCFIFTVGAVVVGTVALLAAKNGLSTETDPLAFAATAGIYYVLLLAIGAFWLISTIVAAVKASSGIRYRHPLILRPLKRSRS